MKANHFQVINGTELSADQLHALHLNKDGNLEEHNFAELSSKEIEALKRIQDLLDELKFGSESC